MSTRKLLFWVFLSVLLVPLRASPKDLLPKSTPLPVPPKAVMPKPADLKETAPKSPAMVQEQPAIVAHQVRNMRAVPGGEEVEIVLTGKSLHRLISAKVMQGAMEVREIKVIPGIKTPTGWTLKLSGKKEALGKAGLSLQLAGGGPPLVVPLSGEINRARSLAGLKGLKETPMVPISPEKQRALGKIKERESAMETARPLAGGPQITEVAPSRGTAGTTVRVRGMNFGGSPPAYMLSINGPTYARSMQIAGWSDTEITARVPVDAPQEILGISVWSGPIGNPSPGVPLHGFPVSNIVRFSVLSPLQEAVSGSVRDVDRIPGTSVAEKINERGVALLPGGSGTPPPPDPGPGTPPAAGCESNSGQPDLTANPRWNLSSVRRGGEAQLAVSVDAETGYVTVVMHNTQFEGGRWIATAGIGSATTTSGRAATATISLRIRSDAPAGDYFPTVTLCRTAGECTSGAGMTISYAGPSRTVTAGINYTRVHNEGFTNVGSAPSCYAIPIVRVTE